MAMTRLQNHLDHWARRRPDAEFAVRAAAPSPGSRPGSRSAGRANALVGLGLPVGARVGVLAVNSNRGLSLNKVGELSHQAAHLDRWWMD